MGLWLSGKRGYKHLDGPNPKILFLLEQHSCIMLAASIPRLSHAGIRLVLWMCCYWLHKVRPSSWCLHRDAKRDSKQVRTNSIRSEVPRRKSQQVPAGRKNSGKSWAISAFRISGGGGASHSGLSPSPANPTPKKQKARCRRTET